MFTTVPIFALGVVGLVAKVGASDSSFFIRRVLNKEVYDSDKQGQNIREEDSSSDSCLADESVDPYTIFRTCLSNTNSNTRREARKGNRKLSSSSTLRVGRGLKMEKTTTHYPPIPSENYNLEIADLAFTLGANIVTSLKDGCDCLVGIERVMTSFISNRFDNNLYNFLCFAITDFSKGDAKGTTTVETEVTFQVENYFEQTVEAAGVCTLEEVVLCCLADDIPGTVATGIDCTRCSLDYCQTSATPGRLPTTQKCEEFTDLQDFLNCHLEGSCVNKAGEADNIFAPLLPPP